MSITSACHSPKPRYQAMKGTSTKIRPASNSTLCATRIGSVFSASCATAAASRGRSRYCRGSSTTLGDRGAADADDADIGNRKVEDPGAERRDDQERKDLEADGVADTVAGRSHVNISRKGSSRVVPVKSPWKGRGRPQRRRL